jgi:hypothetical protein
MMPPCRFAGGLEGVRDGCPSHSGAASTSQKSCTSRSDERKKLMPGPTCLTERSSGGAAVATLPPHRPPLVLSGSTTPQAQTHQAAEEQQCQRRRLGNNHHVIDVDGPGRSVAGSTAPANPDDVRH